ncbi:MAG: hypothetical protein K0R85_2617 [Devosia sp.]|nr:hypothetical protein [Devosia sp.]
MNTGITASLSNTRVTPPSKRSRMRECRLVLDGLGRIAPACDLAQLHRDIMAAEKTGNVPAIDDAIRLTGFVGDGGHDNAGGQFEQRQRILDRAR